MTHFLSPPPHIHTHTHRRRNWVISMPDCWVTRTRSKRSNMSRSSKMKMPVWNWWVCHSYGNPPPPGLLLCTEIGVDNIQNFTMANLQHELVVQSQSWELGNCLIPRTKGLCRNCHVCMSISMTVVFITLLLNLPTSMAMHVYSVGGDSAEDWDFSSQADHQETRRGERAEINTWKCTTCT